MRYRGRILASRAVHIPRSAQIRVLGDGRRDVRWWKNLELASRVRGRRKALDPEASRIATPGQAGSPAEFKDINKRRKRNLPGFP